ncbi:hypothetical protein QFZ69_001811 [Arthrobacter sp. V1I7]|nr:hypothetical protein [Arthrobacter sp. V1I7]
MSPTITENAEQDAEQNGDVERGVLCVEHYRRRHDGGGDRHERDHGDPPGTEEQPEQRHCDQQADQQRYAKTVHGVLDGSGGTEHAGVDLDAGKPGLHVPQGCLDSLGDLHCAGAWELFNNQHQARILADDGVADQGLMVFLDLGDVAQHHRLGRVLHTYLGQIGRGADRKDVLDAQTLAG